MEGHNRAIKKIKELIQEQKSVAHSRNIHLPRNRKRGRGNQGKGRPRKKQRREDGPHAADDEEDDKESDSEVDSDVDQFDFNFVDKKLLKIANEVDFQQKKKNFQRQIKECEEEIAIMVPNLKSIGVFDEIKEKIKSYNNEFDMAKKTLSDASSEFREIKQARTTAFQDCFEHVKNSISEIYKSLTRSKSFPTGGKAFLCLESAGSDDFLGGIRYHAMPPMKRFRDMEQLSGGEKSVASLALCFAINSYKPSPFFVLDEVDAALDHANVSKVANYVKSRSSSETDPLQILVISLKESFYERADALIGIYKDQESQASGAICVSFDEV